jgi:sec-independent protein translocase protein TatC
MSQEKSSTSATSFWEHVDELRRTFLRIVFIILIAFVWCLFFKDTIFDVLALPLQKLNHEKSGTALLKPLIVTKQRIVNHGPGDATYTLSNEAEAHHPLLDGVQKIDERIYRIPENLYLDLQIAQEKKELMIFGPVDGLMTSLKVCFWTGLAGSSPLWMGCILLFIAPGLNRKEQGYLFPFLLLSCLFLVLGILFAFYFTIPIANHYLYTFNASIGVNLWSLSNYLNYTVLLLLANGLAFELFVILIFLVQLNILTAQVMASKRRFAIIGAFVLGAIMTPPDIPSQLMLACPLIVLYEIAILYARLRSPRAVPHILASEFD